MRKLCPALLLASLLLAGCSRSTAPSVIGSWQCTENLGTTPNDIITMTETFRPDGTGTLTSSHDGAVVDTDFQYTVSGDAITQTYAQVQDNSTLHLSADTLTVLDKDGSAAYVLHRQSN